MVYKQQIYFSRFQRLGRPRSRCQQIWFWCKPTSQFIAVFLPFSHKVERARDLSRVSLIRALIPVTRAPHLHDLIASQRPHHLIPSHWELGFNIQILGGHKHSVYSVMLINPSLGSYKYLQVYSRISRDEEAIELQIVQISISELFSDSLKARKTLTSVPFICVLYFLTIPNIMMGNNFQPCWFYFEYVKYNMTLTPKLFLFF